ncbi:MAG: BON domain-containing protein [Maricaulaceae bacterium]
MIRLCFRTVRPRAVLLATLAVVPALSLNACAAAARVAGAERSIGESVDDANLGVSVRSALLRRDDFVLGGVDVTTFQGFVLLTGYVPTERDKQGAQALVEPIVGGPQNIGNALIIDNKPGVSSDAADGLISTEVRRRITGDPFIKGVNYEIITVDGVVHLLGAGRTAEEIERAVDVARLTPNVKRVVSYVRLIPAGGL